MIICPLGEAFAVTIPCSLPYILSKNIKGDIHIDAVLAGILPAAEQIIKLIDENIVP